jgi:hypothetical protein
MEVHRYATAPTEGVQVTTPVTPTAPMGGVLVMVTFPGLPVLTTTVTEAHAVILQSPSALTKYVVVNEGETVMVVMPLYAGKAVPPHEPVYHFQVAASPSEPPFMVSVIDSPRQMLL